MNRTVISIAVVAAVVGVSAVAWVQAQQAQSPQQADRPDPVAQRMQNHRAHVPTARADAEAVEVRLGPVDPEARAEVGSAAPDFVLANVYGKPYSLSEFRGQVVVIDFNSVRCPWSLGFDAEHRRLWREYAPQGVQFLAINSNHNDTLAEVRLHQIGKDLTFPQLKDYGNRVADVYQARTTPHVYIVDAEGVLVYAGQPCDRGAGAAEPDARSNNISEILDALVAGEDVEPRQTAPWGCTVKRVSDGQ
jgi:peroxiredoxin